MKKQLTKLGFLAFLFTAMSIVAFTPQQPNKDKQKEQQQGQGRDKKGKKDSIDNKGRKDEAGNKKDATGNKGKEDMKEDRGKSDENKNKGSRGKIEGYSWDRETFKDRKKLKTQEKVTICHKFNRADDPAVTIRVSSNALKAHMDHGDVMGDCPVLAKGRFSDDYLRKRTDYYNNLQENQERVLYSQSILDYALTRLAEARLQLDTYRNSNMPVVEIERKQAVVVELEQNVSLLETLIGAAANIIVNKLL